MTATTLNTETTRTLIAKCVCGKMYRSVIIVNDPINGTILPASHESHCWHADRNNWWHLNYKRVKSTKTTKVCNTLCWDATGASCNCSCDGENHGRTHAT